MNWNEFVSKIVEQIIASIPQIVLVLSSIIYYLSNVKKKVSLFPENLSKTEKTLSDSFDKIPVMLENVEDKLINVIDVSINKISEKVNVTLDNMQEELEKYQKTLENSEKQNNTLALENKLFLDIITRLASQDVTKIRDGVATVLSAVNGASSFDTDSLVKDTTYVENNLKLMIEVVGEKRFYKILERINNEKAKEL